MPQAIIGIEVRHWRWLWGWCFGWCRGRLGFRLRLGLGLRFRLDLGNGLLFGLSRWRRRGIGRQVLEAVLAWASDRGATRAQLLADLDNQPALDYYQHLGWDETRLIARRLSLQLRP